MIIQNIKTTSTVFYHCSISLGNSSSQAVCQCSLLFYSVVQSTRKQVVHVHTSRSSPRQQGADRCTAYMRCPSRFHPLSIVFPWTHIELQQHIVIWNKHKHLFEHKHFFLRSSCSYLWSQSGTAWVQQSHHWPAEESLQLLAQNEPQRAPSSYGLVNLVWSPHSLCSLIYTSCSFTVAAWRWRQHRHMTHRPGWRRCEPCHLLGNEEVLICGR